MPECPLSPPEDAPVKFCEGDDCIDTAIYAGQDYYEIDGNVYCESCGRTYLDFLYKVTATI